MKNILLRLFVPISLLFFMCGVVFAAKPFNMERVVLLQPEVVMRERAGDVHAFAGYIKELTSTSDSILKKVKSPNPSAGYIVVAVRPNGASRVWLDFTPTLSKSLDSGLRTSLQAVKPFQAQKGTVVFAIGATLWGANPVERTPMPAEWTKAIKDGESIEVGDLVDKIW